MDTTTADRDALRASVRDALAKLAERDGPSRVAMRFGLSPISIKRYMAGDCPSFTAARRMAQRLGVKS